MLARLKSLIRIILNKNIYKNLNSRIKKFLSIALQILLIVNKIQNVNNYRKTLKKHFILQNK